MGLQHVNFQPEVGDLSGTARVDGYVEAVSLLGYGVLVVTPDKLDELVATGEWEELETEE